MFIPKRVLMAFAAITLGNAAFGLEIELSKVSVEVAKSSRAKATLELAKKELLDHIALVNGDAVQGGGVQFILGRAPIAGEKIEKYTSYAAVHDGKVWMWGDDMALTKYFSPAIAEQASKKKFCSNPDKWRTSFDTPGLEGWRCRDGFRKITDATASFDRYSAELVANGEDTIALHRSDVAVNPGSCYRVMYAAKLSDGISNVRVKTVSNRTTLGAAYVKAASELWQDTEYTFTAPLDCTNVTMYVIVSGKKGAVAWVDDIHSEVVSRNFSAEIAACSSRGGGTVEVPAGVWNTGRIELKSNVELHLNDNAVLLFSDNPKDYLPAVLTSWEGVECYNYSPLIYALDATNIAITGNGRLEAKMDTWRSWGGLRKAPAEAAKVKLVMEWGLNDEPVENRDLTKLPGSNLRPPFIGLNRCNGIKLKDFKLRNSPFWCIHILHSENVVLRGLDLKADINNSDGANFECTKHVLVEDCVFSQGDDVICCKAGLDRDGLRRGISTEDVTVRRCRALSGHGFLTVGSECSGGVRNVTMEDCEIEGSCLTLLNIKTRPTRGGFIENVAVKRVKAKDVTRAVVNVTTSSQAWSKYEVGKRICTRISGLLAEDITVEKATRVLNILGDERQPIKDVTVRRVTAEAVQNPNVIQNADVR